MKTITINLSNKDAKKYSLETENLNFDNLIDKVKNVLAKETLEKCNTETRGLELDSLTMAEINKEVRAVRDAKGSH